MTFELGPEHIAAQLAATLVFANQGATGRVKIYIDGDVLQTDTPLANPCGTISGTLLTLIPSSAGGTLILVTGTPRRAEWLNGQGKLVAKGTVSDADHTGDFRIAGSGTAAGETSPTLYAGGLLLLGGLTFS